MLVVVLLLDVISPCHRPFLVFPARKGLAPGRRPKALGGLRRIKAETVPVSSK